jgi:hypothetical protein
MRQLTSIPAYYMRWHSRKESSKSGSLSPTMILVRGQFEGKL